MSEQIIAMENLEMEQVAAISEAVSDANTPKYEIKWHSSEAQEVKINGCYTVSVIGTYKPQGHLISGIGNSYGPSFLSFVGPWVEGTSELVDVPPPCENWEEVLEAYEKHQLLVPLFFTYQHASDWLAMLDHKNVPFGGTLIVKKYMLNQHVKVSFDGHNHCFIKGNGYDTSEDEFICFRDGLWAIERLLHSDSEFITSTEVEDEENEWTYTKYSFIDKEYLEGLSPQELRRASHGYIYFSDQYLYHTFAKWQIEMIKAADKGDELAFSTAVDIGLFV